MLPVHCPKGEAFVGTGCMPTAQAEMTPIGAEREMVRIGVRSTRCKAGTVWDGVACIRDLSGRDAKLPGTVRHLIRHHKAATPVPTPRPLKPGECPQGMQWDGVACIADLTDVITSIILASRLSPTSLRILQLPRQAKTIHTDICGRQSYRLSVRAC